MTRVRATGLRSIASRNSPAISPDQASAPLARAIFKAARTEYPDRRVTLSRGKRVVAESGE